jgi:hypothetical protein
VKDTGAFNDTLTREPTDFLIYERGDPKRNETAFREALPAWYVSIKP